jgi:hypothetical protein
MNTKRHETRLMDGEFSSGFEALDKLAKCREFSGELVHVINCGGAEEAVCAMRRHFFPSPPEPVFAESIPLDHFLISVDGGSFPFSNEIPFEFFRRMEIGYPKGTKKIAQEVIRALHASCALKEWPKNGGCLVYRMALQGRNSSETWIAKAAEYRTEFAPNGYRPLTDLEMFEVYQKNQRMFWHRSTIALGSYLLTEQHMRLACVLRCDIPGGGILGQFDLLPYDSNVPEGYTMLCTPIP